MNSPEAVAVPIDELAIAAQRQTDQAAEILRLQARITELEKLTWERGYLESLLRRAMHSGRVRRDVAKQYARPFTEPWLDDAERFFQDHSVEDRLSAAVEERDALFRLVEQFKIAAGVQDSADPIGDIEKMAALARGE